jgi:hypothetical protein
VRTVNALSRRKAIKNRRILVDKGVVGVGDVLVLLDGGDCGLRREVGRDGDDEEEDV